MFADTAAAAADTASEHRMFERLMVEDLVHWARDYKVSAAPSTQLPAVQ
jgi:pullulanase/glycogen debranching enzyme